MTNSYDALDSPPLIPYLTVRNAEEAVKFYKDAFGFEERHISHDEANNIVHVEMHK